jgi:hypothetical protein
MTNARSPLLALLPLVAVAACDRGGTPALPPAAEPLPAVAAPPPGTSIAAQLQREASERPAIPLRAEQVVAALESAGIPLDPPRQVLGLTVRARYCVSASGAAGLGVAICEYPDSAAAAAGRQYSIDRFGALQPNRRIEQKGSLTLTLTVPSSPDGDAAARAAAGALARL